MSTTPVAADVATRDRVWLVGGAAFVLFAVVVGASIGPAGPDWWRVPLALVDHLPLIAFDTGVSDSEWAIVWKVRMPRVVLGGLVGGMLSIAGAGYQGVFRNPLVDPYLLGAAAGAGLGATIALTVGRSATVGWPIDPVPAVAFGFAVVTVMVTYSVGSSFGGSRSGVTLVLAGVAVVSFATAAQTFVLQRNLDAVREVFRWILGSLSQSTWGDVRLVTPYVVVSSIVLLLHRRHLDVFRVGDDEAATLGVSVGRTRFVIVVAATLGTAAVVAVSGLIGFVGLVVPHVVRMIAGARNRRVLPLSLMVGAGFLVLADVPGRMLSNPAETPIGVVTAFIGAPFFIYLLRTREGRGVTLLHLSEVEVAYRKRQALQPFTETFEPGEWVGLIGPNGAGKSSLLRAIAGLVHHSGAITLDGRNLEDLPPRDRARAVAYVPQEPLIPDDMTVSDYVLLGRTPYIGYWATESNDDRDVAERMLSLLHLDGFAERPLGSMSGGERQRAVLARALAQEAPVLLLDEPTSALDIGHQQQALELVTELRRDRQLTVVSALHDLTLAGTYTDRLVMLHEGRRVVSGPAAEVLTADRLGEVYRVCVTVDVDPEDGTVIVVPRRGFPAP